MNDEPMSPELQALYAQLQRALAAMKPEEPLPWDGMESDKGAEE